ncbi:unnamed protein product [Calypogeia fissa]
MHADFMDDQMVQDAKIWLSQKQIHSFGDLREAGTMKIFDYGKEEISRVHVDVEDLIRTAMLPDPDVEAEIQSSEESDIQALRAGVSMHVGMANFLFNRHLCEQVSLPTGLFDEEELSSAEEV